MTNVIAHGGAGTTGYDVVAQNDSSVGSKATVNASYSNFATSNTTIGTGENHINGDATNQASPPLFADAANRDFHQLAGSPTVDAGVDSAANGATDFDGEGRPQGARTDIGADELPVAAVAPPMVDVAPALSSLTATNKVFAVDRKGQVARQRKVKHGTTFRFTLSEAATLRFTVERRTTGRKVGKRCRVKTRKNRQRKRCVRYVKQRTFTRNGTAGANRVPFSGRIRVRRRVRALKRGRYRMSLGAVDAGGKRSKTVRVKFRIVKG